MTLYVLDTNTLSTIFRFYYQNVFVTFWTMFDNLLVNRGAISVRQVRPELERWGGSDAWVSHLLANNPDFFADNTLNELGAMGEFMNSSPLATALAGWMHNIGPDEPTVADPYLIAKAMLSSDLATVVTQESPVRNSTSRIPYVCGQLGVPCINLEQMMSQLGWRF